MDWNILDHRFREGDDLIDEIREGHLALLRNPADGEKSKDTVLKLLEDLGVAEESTQREYSGRYLFELLQNANDAIRDGIENNSEAKGGCFSVAIVLTNKSLLFANQGMPFRTENVEAICRLGQTTKLASKRLGHKGIGFKSVLEITDSPEVFSTNFAFGFDRRACYHTLQEIVPGISPDIALPIHRFPFSHSLANVDQDDRSVIVDLFEQGYVTVIRLPLIVSPHQVENQIKQDIVPSILLFLNAIELIEICLPDGTSSQLHREDVTGSNQDFSKQVILIERKGTTEKKTRWLLICPPYIEITDKSLLKGLGRAWKTVDRVSFSFAFRLTLHGQPLLPRDEYPFHVYFPTQDASGFRFIINADLYIAASRKHIPENAYNLWLGKKAIAFLVSQVVEILKLHFPDNPYLVKILTPVHQSHGEFGQLFYDAYKQQLSLCEFVPAGECKYLTPANVRFVPEGAPTLKFRQMFPMEILSHSGAQWSYPLLDLEERDLTSFLVEVGASYLKIEDILPVVINGPQIDTHKAKGFIQFLSLWWDSLGSKRAEFEKQIRQAAIIPTSRGWRKPPSENDLIFQANLRQDGLDVPEGFHFEIIVKEIYGKEGYRGLEFRFLKQLGVTDYDAREIARRAMLPILTDEKLVSKLSKQSLLDAFIFLKDNQPNLDGRQANILLPANSSGQDTIYWRPAKEVYFGEYWTGNDDLESIYSDIPSVYFLNRPLFLSRLTEEKREKWHAFFQWLGVSLLPRLVPITQAPSFSTLRDRYSLSGQPLWGSYIDSYWSLFKCNNPGHPFETYRFIDVHTIDRLESILSLGKRSSLKRLFRLLATNWRETYASKSQAVIRCDRVSCNQPYRRIPNYFLHLLRTQSWIPARVRDMDVSQLLPPCEVWNLGQSEPTAVQRMVPILHKDLREDEYAAFLSDLNFMDSARARFEDFLALLQRLPELYPLELAELEKNRLKQWQDDIRTVFNWICQSLQNIINRGEARIPQRPASLKVFAYFGGNPCYVDTVDPLLVYPDDPYMAERWEDTCYFLRVDDDWRRLRDWLGVDNLSNRIKPESPQFIEDERESRRLQRQYQDVLPYFLAVIEKSQPSRLEELIGRLKRLELKAVKELWIRQRLDGTEIEPKQYQEKVYMNILDIPGDRGRPVRKGILYIALLNREINLDLLGRPIASYVEIDRLADAFVMLMERNETGRIRYLTSRYGIGKEDVEHATGILKKSRGERMPTPKDDKDIQNALKKLEGQFTQESPEAEPEPEKIEGEPTATADDDGNGQVEQEEAPVDTHVHELELPKIEDIEITWTDFDPNSDVLPKRHSGKGGRGIGGPGRHFDWANIQAHERQIGKRGEEIVFKCYEPQRLAKLKYSRDTIKKSLRWVSSWDETANHDIESLDEKGNPIWIEVKATSGDDNLIEMGIEEFKAAISRGDQYYLYRVYQATSNQPLIVRYRNPAKLWQEKKILIDIAHIKLTLPLTEIENQN